MSLAVVWATTAPAKAQGLSLIRDAEIETTIRSYATPLFGAAGLNASAIRVHIVNDSKLNAFVAGGLNLFINTGLLTAAEGPGEIIGVIAHETGHILGGHLVRTREALKNASAQTILASILAGAAILAGQGEAGQAIITGGSAAAQDSLLRYSRAQEQTADQAAVRLLDATGQSSRGLLEMFHRLEDQELIALARQDPYLRSHPLTRERISFVRNHLEKSRFSDAPPDPATLDAHRRMVAKIKAFLEPPARTLRAYPPSDTSLYGRYARAIAYYRTPDLARALAELDALIAERPDDPWFHELRGQILFENGRAAEAVAPYVRAAALRPDAPLIRFGLARALMETGDPAVNDQAIEHLRVATAMEGNHPPYWHFLGLAYARAGETAMASLAQAEAAYLRRDMPQAKYHAERAAAGVKTGSPAWLRAEDIRNAAETALEKRR